MILSSLGLLVAHNELLKPFTSESAQEKASASRKQASIAPKVRSPILTDRDMFIDDKKTLAISGAETASAAFQGVFEDKVDSTEDGEAQLRYSRLFKGVTGKIYCLDSKAPTYEATSTDILYQHLSGRLHGYWTTVDDKASEIASNASPALEEPPVLSSVAGVITGILGSKKQGTLIDTITNSEMIVEKKETAKNVFQSKVIILSNVLNILYGLASLCTILHSSLLDIPAAVQNILGIAATHIGTLQLIPALSILVSLLGLGVLAKSMHDRRMLIKELQFETDDEGIKKYQLMKEKFFTLTPEETKAIKEGGLKQFSADSPLLEKFIEQKSADKLAAKQLALAQIVGTDNATSLSVMFKRIEFHRVGLTDSIAEKDAADLVRATIALAQKQQLLSGLHAFILSLSIVFAICAISGLSVGYAGTVIVLLLLVAAELFKRTYVEPNAQQHLNLSPRKMKKDLELLSILEAALGGTKKDNLELYTKILLCREIDFEREMALLLRQMKSHRFRHLEGASHYIKVALSALLPIDGSNKESSIKAMERDYKNQHAALLTALNKEVTDINQEVAQLKTDHVPKVRKLRRCIMGSFNDMSGVSWEAKEPDYLKYKEYKVLNRGGPVPAV